MLAGYSLLQVLVLVVVIAAALAIVHIVLARMGVAIPAWVVQIFWVLVVAVVGVAALYLLFSLVGRL